MTENLQAPYIIQINEPFQTIHLSEELSNLGLHIESSPHNISALNAVTNPQILVDPIENPVELVQTAPTIPQSFTLVKQEEQPCILQIVYPQDLCLSTPQTVMKRGRPKKKKPGEAQVNENAKVQIEQAPPKTARTRSGRLVKLPKYIEKDFKKIEITTDEQDVQVTDFKRFEEKENSKVEFPEVQTKKRVISAQYKCPKCFKAYLGKNKMIQHLKKYPDHGPLPEGFQEFNFDVWNYLFDITQKCKSGQRGVKFCEELSNLLHNVQLLKSALFKTVTDNKNCVQIDKVLGNAIGLSPGKYKFDENELYKDVTVLKLITNSDFFKPNVSTKSDATITKNKKEDDVRLGEAENKKIKQDIIAENTFSIDACSDDAVKDIYTFPPKSDKTQENAITDTFSKKMDVDNQILPSDLLTEDNLLLHSLPNTRNSVEELMLTSVDHSSNLLDNSTSSDEVMNVDQFVNERFKKIIEPDIELSNTSLNLDLPSLELFQFHTS